MNLSNFGKDLLSGLKSLATAEIQGATQGVANVGQGLLDKLLVQLKLLGFLIAGGTLLLWGLTLLIAEKAQQPIWVIALSLGTLVILWGWMWIRRQSAVPPSSPSQQ